MKRNILDVIVDRLEEVKYLKGRTTQGAVHAQHRFRAALDRLKKQNPWTLHVPVPKKKSYDEDA